MEDDFTPAELAAWGGLVRAFAVMDQAIEADLRTHDGLRHVELEVLLRLSRAPGHRMRLADLASGSLLTRSGLSRLVDRLERAGLVDREQADEDGRGAYAVLTDEGDDLFASVWPRHVRLVRRLFHSRLTEDDVAALGAIWSRVNATRPAPDA